jgi:hypothetical protein
MSDNNFEKKEQELQEKLKQCVIDFANGNLKPCDWPHWDIPIDDDCDAIYFNGQLVWKRE